MKSVFSLFLFIFVVLSTPVICQSKQSAFSTSNLELSGGWVHSTGNSGLDGFNLGASLWFNKRVSIAFDYDHAGDTSTLGNFGLTSAGLISVKSHMQNWLIGPRVFFPTKRVKRFDLDPFGEFQFGGTYLNQKISQAGAASMSASDSAYSWMLGGGADYVLSPHWAARGNLDLLRTHLSDMGQTRLRFVLGVAYTFASRK
jgi:hypothetical protein